MKTNAIYDGAWRDLQVAVRSENIHRIIQAAEHLAYAARTVQLDQQQQSEEDKVLPLGQKPYQSVVTYEGPAKYK